MSKEIGRTINIYVDRLKRELEHTPFDVLEATNLSLEIHDAEVHGYFITDYESEFWKQLSLKIQEHYK
jgi:hypothetical protein